MARTVSVRPLAPLAMVIAATGTIVLLLAAGGYGFHRDELYFVVAGRHPALGYVDQGPLTPLLAAAGVALLGPIPIAVRILPAFSYGTCVLLAALMARDLGGGSRAQVVAALCVALSGLLLAGHLAATATVDILASCLICWLGIRLLGGADPRLWLAVGVVGGIALLNKWTIALLPLGLFVGLLIERRWAILRSPWPWAGAAVALLVWAPNLAWQATEGFPQLEMARRIAEHSGAENRAQLIPLQLLLAGPLLWPIMLIGLWQLIRAASLRPWRAFAWAYLVAVALTWWQEGKAYYLFGFFPVLFAAGAVTVGAWLGRGRRGWRAAILIGAALVSGALIAVVTLPIVPASALTSSGIGDVNKESAEQVGWPELVATVEDAVHGLPPDERAHAVIVTASYGEAGALELLGRDLPPVTSGHNSYWDFGRPPDGATTAILVGDVWPLGLGPCATLATIDNAAGVDNQERGAPVKACDASGVDWATLWPEYRHLD